MTARRSASFLAVALAAGALVAPSPARALTCPASRPAGRGGARAIAGRPETARGAPAEAAAAQQRLVARVGGAVRRVWDALGAERRARQALIDTPREYRRVGAACG